MGLKDKVITGIKWTTISNLTIAVLQIVRLAILTRLLEKSDFGLIAIALMIVGFTDIFSGLGVASAVIHKQNITEKQYSSIYWLNIIISIVSFSLVCIVTPFLASFYNQPILVKIVPLLGLQILFNGFGKVFQTIKMKELEFDFISKISIATAFLGFVVSICLAYLKFGVYSLVYGVLVQSLFAQFIYMIAGFGKNKIWFHLNFTEIKDFIRIGLYQLGAQILDFISTKIDVFLIGYFFGMQNLGIYNIAKELILKPYQIINSLVSNVASSAFSKMQKNISQIKENYSKIIEIVCLISFPIYICIFIFSEQIVDILYAPSFWEVSFFLKVLSIVGICNSLNSSAGILQIALGRTDMGFKWTMIRFILTTLSILICSRFSIYYVAYAQVAISLLFLMLYWKLIILPLSTLTFKEYIETFIKALLFSVLTGLVVLIIKLLVNYSFTSSVILLAIYTFVYVVLNYLFNKKITKQVIEVLLNKASRHCEI